MVQKPSCLLACLLGRQQLPEQSCVSTIYSRGPTRAAAGREPRADLPPLSTLPVCQTVSECVPESRVDAESISTPVDS